MPAPTCTEGPFAAQGNPAGQRRRGAEELAQPVRSVMRPSRGKERGLGLRHTAAARIGKETIEQIANAERTCDRQ